MLYALLAFVLHKFPDTNKIEFTDNEIDKTYIDVTKIDVTLLSIGGLKPITIHKPYTCGKIIRKTKF